MRNLSAYAQIGAALVLAGVIAAPIFYFVAESVPLTALAFSAVLLGMISLLFARSLPKVPPQAAQILLEAGLDNLAGLLEEIGASASAIYPPSSLSGGKSKALIPLHSNPAAPTITRSLTNRMIVDFGPSPEDMGILVTTPGTAAMQFLEEPPGSTSSELEAALARVLVGALDLARSVQVAQESGVVTVRVSGVRFDHRDRWIDRLLGSPIASVVAAVAAEGLGKPVMVESEEREADRLTVRLRVVA